jgi:hypothetical protein
MHENREISSAPSEVLEGRSVKAHGRTTDMYVLEKSDCAVLSVNRPNKGGQLPAEYMGNTRAIAHLPEIINEEKRQRRVRM